MSGGEAALVLGLISSIITIIDTTKKVYEAATNKTGLPKAFGECAIKLPLVKNILGELEKGNVDEKGCKEAKEVTEGCKRKATTLEELFEKVIAADGDSRPKRYYKAVKILGKGNEVESLMKGILEDLALLSSERIMKTPTKTQLEQIAKATSEIQDVPNSVPEDLFQETGPTVNHSGSGTQYNPWRESIVQGRGQQWNAPGGTIHFAYSKIHNTSVLQTTGDHGARMCLRSPPPSSTVPFRRDPDFIDSNILLELKQKCSVPASRVALVGLGGIGKSQLAIEYCYRTRDKSSNTWVFWVHASTAARFEEGYRIIAETVGLDGWDRSETNILNQVSNWLRDERNGHWVMIVDNADDEEVFFRKSSDYGVAQEGRSLSNFLPQTSHGSIIITSRRHDLAFRLTGRRSDIIEIKPMKEGRAIALLEKKLPEAFERADAIQLAKILDYVPLALTQAAAYITQSRWLVTISKYLQKLDGDKDRERLLRKDLGDVRRDEGASNAIMDTWAISFDYIRKVQPSAARLLSLMSLFDRQGIPQSLLLEEYKADDKDAADLDDDILILVNYSLVMVNVQGNEFEMHRLVQISMKAWLQKSHQLENWVEKYVHMLNIAFPDGNYENWTIWQQLFPHACKVCSYNPKNLNFVHYWTSILTKAATYSQTKGKYEQAEEMNRLALSGREKVLGKEHPFTLTSMTNLASVLRNQGKYEQAEELNRAALLGYKKVLGNDHPDTLTSMDNLALVLRNQGKYEQAEGMTRVALLGREKVLGKEHSSTLTSMNNLALVLGDQGKFEQAEGMNRVALSGYEKVLGKEHPGTLMSMNNLASVLGSQGKYEQAEAMNRVALSGRQKVLGKEHSSTLMSMNNLSLVFNAQGKYKQAEEMSRVALSGREKVLGKEHP